MHRGGRGFESLQVHQINVGMQKEVLLKIKKLVSKEEYSESDISHMVSLMRKVLEDAFDKSKFPLLSFYSDWALHSSISRSKIGLEMLKKMQEILILNRNEDPYKVSSEVTKLLSVSMLRGEIQRFFEKCDIPVDIINWASFIVNLMEIIREIPIIFPKKMTGDVLALFNNMQRNPIKPGMVVSQLSIIKTDLSVLPGKEEVFCWMLTTSNTTKIIGVLVADSLF